MQSSFQAFRHRLLALHSSRGRSHRLCNQGPQQRISFATLHAAPHQALRAHSPHQAMAVLQAQTILANGSADNSEMQTKSLAGHESSPSTGVAAEPAIEHARLTHKHGLEDSAAADGDIASSAPQ